MSHTDYRDNKRLRFDPKREKYLLFSLNKEEIIISKAKARY